ncbi:MAG TPA: hypothetical protein VJ552_13355 [Sediminibacterium sp.]|nr:hypothetical protein [Sediminibacterium sp.]
MKNYFYEVNQDQSLYVRIVLQFAIEGWMISDLYSFITGEPATYHIDAIEDAELLLITQSAQQES